MLETAPVAWPGHCGYASPVSEPAPRKATWDDPVGCSLEAYRREQEGYLLIIAAHGLGRLRVPPFEAIELELDLLWGDRFDPTLRSRDG